MTIPSLKNQVKAKGASLPYFSFKVLMNIMENRSFREKYGVSYHILGRLSRMNVIPSQCTHWRGIPEIEVDCEPV